MKKILKVSILLILTLSLVACSGKKKDKVTEVGTVGAMESYNVGDTFKATEEITISFLYRDHPNYQYQEDWLFWDKLKEITNVTIDPTIVPLSDFEERKSLLIGAGDEPLIIPNSPVGSEATYASSGAILPVSDYLEYMPHFTQKAKDWGLEDQLDSIRHKDGKFYLLPTMYENVWPDYTVAYRADILEKHNIPLPTTWDELAEVMIQLKEIYPDNFIFSDRWQANALFNVAARQFGISAGWGYGNGMTFDKDKDEFVYMTRTEGFKEFVEYFRNLVDNDVFDIESFTQDDDQAVQKFVTGQSFFITTNAQELIKHRQTMEETLNEDFEVKKLVVPAGPEGNVIYGQRLDYGVMISNKILENENFKAILQFIDWLYYSDEGREFVIWGVEGETYNVVDGKRVPREDISFVHFNEGAPTHLQSDYGFFNGVFLYGGVTTDLLHSIMEDEEIEFQEAMLSKEYTDVLPAAPLDDAEGEEASMLSTPLQDMTEQYMMSVITGSKSLDDYETFLEELDGTGMSRYEEMLTNAYKEMKDVIE